MSVYVLIFGAVPELTKFMVEIWAVGLSTFESSPIWCETGLVECTLKSL